MQPVIELLNKAEAAERLRIKPCSLDKMAKAGRGPTITRITGRVFYRPEHLNEWVDAQSKPTAKAEL